MVRVVDYIHQAPRTIRALLAPPRVASKSRSLLADEERAGLMLGMMGFDVEEVEFEEYHLLMFCAL